MSRELIHLVTEIFGDQFSEKSKKADESYQRARGLGEGEDFMKLHDLFARRGSIETDYGDLSELHARANRLINSGVENAPEDEIASLAAAVVAASKRMGMDFRLQGTRDPETGKQTSLDASQLNNALNMLMARHTETVSQIDQNISPEKAASLNYAYRLMGDKSRKEYLASTPLQGLISGINNEYEGGDKTIQNIAKEMGKRGPSGLATMSARAKGEDPSKLWGPVVEKWTDEERSAFHEQLQAAALAEMEKRSKEDEAEYKSRSEEQRSTLSSWQTDREKFTSDLGKLREAGYVSPTQAQDYLTRNDYEQFVKTDEAKRMAADTVSLNRDDQSSKDSFGGTVGSGVTGGAAGGTSGLPGSGVGAGDPGSAALRGASIRAGAAAAQKGVEWGALGGEESLLSRGLGAAKRFAPLGIGLSALSAMTDLSPMSGRTGAASITNAGTEMLPSLFGTIGTAFEPGLGTLAGTALGYGLSKTVGAAMRPYEQQVNYARNIESVTGENLEGAGAPSNFLQSLQVATPIWQSTGAGALREAQNRARLQNPFFDPKQIDQLSESLLKLGMSTDSTTKAIEPLTSVMANFNISPELTANLMRAGQATPGGLGGVNNAQYVAQQIQAQSGRGFTQQDVSGYVQTGLKTLGPTYGYENATNTALAYSSLLSRGGPQSDYLFQQSGTANKMMQSDAQISEDVGANLIMGIPLNSSPSSPGYQANVAAGRVSAANRLVGMVPKDSKGQPTVMGRAMLENLKSQYPYNTIFGNMSLPEIIRLGTDKNITPQSAKTDFQNQQKAQQQAQQKQKNASFGIGASSHTYKGLGNTLIDNLNPFPNKQSTNASAFRASDDASKWGIGAVGELLQQNNNTSLSSIRLSGGGTLADAAKNPALMKALNTGKRKIMVDGKQVKVSDFNLAEAQNSAFVGSKGVPHFGDGTSKTEKGGQQIGLSPEASRFFQMENIQPSSGSASAAVDSAQRNYQVNQGKSTLNNRPVPGR